MKEEIVDGLRNAIEHGSSLEKAKDSFTNAGYNRYEVDAAARIVSSGGGASRIISNDGESTDEIPRETEIEKKDDEKKWLLIILIVVALLVLLGAVGYLIYVLLK